MTPREITLVQTVFQRLRPIVDRVSALFHARLFELDASLRGLVRGDRADRGRQLMRTLGHAVARLDRIEKLLPALRELGLRHARHGITYAHYATIGAALLWTLEKGLGPVFTAEVREAWKTVYAVLAGTMVDAANARMAV